MSDEQIRTSPILQAADLRKQMTEAVELRVPLSLKGIQWNVGACLIGMGEEILKRHGLLALIKTDEEGFSMWLDCTEEIALEAFRSWREDQDEKAAIPFKQNQYLALYSLIQAVREEQGKEVIQGVEGFFLKLLEEKDPRLEGLYSVIAKDGWIPAEDLSKLRARLILMWNDLPQEIQWSIDQYHYSNLF
jgi:hypothetical protein